MLALLSDGGLAPVQAAMEVGGREGKIRSAQQPICRLPSLVTETQMPTAIQFKSPRLNHLLVPLSPLGVIPFT